MAQNNQLSRIVFSSDNLLIIVHYFFRKVNGTTR